MKIKHLTLSFLACASLAACGPPPAENATSTTAAAPERMLHQLTCRDIQGNITAQVESSVLNVEILNDNYVRYELDNGRSVRAQGGSCVTLTTRLAPLAREGAAP